jgi:sugar lactone lactonase YvrE
VSIHAAVYRFVVIAILLCLFGPGLSTAQAQRSYHYLKTIAAPQPGQFKLPYSLAVDPSGNIYVADTLNFRIQKFDKDGNFLLTFGGITNPDVEGGPGVATDAFGNVYVTDDGGGYVAKYDSNGTFISKFGANGSGNGQLKLPEGVVVDSTGDIYVADTGNYRVEKFDKNGNFLLTFGSKGSGIGQFGQEMNIALDHQGNVYVADAENQRVQKFDKNGNFLLSFGSNVYGIAVDNAGNIYVTGASGVQKFNSKGTFLLSFGTSGSGDGQSVQPFGIAIDGSGNVLVTDIESNIVAKFDSNGKFLSKYGQPDTLLSPSYLAFDRDGNLLVTDPGRFRVAKIDKYGTLLSTFSAPPSSYSPFNPTGITVDPSGNIFVSENQGFRVDKFDRNDVFQFAFGQKGANNNQFQFPEQIASDSVGNLYIADSGNHCVKKFSGQGTFLGQISSFGSANGQVTNPQGVAVDNVGNVFILDHAFYSSVQKFNAQGQYLLTVPMFPSVISNLLPQALAVDPVGSLYMTINLGLPQIEKFNNDGTSVTQFPQFGAAEGQIGSPIGIALDSQGNIYIADNSASQIVIYAPDPPIHSVNLAPNLTRTATGVGATLTLTNNGDFTENITVKRVIMGVTPPYPVLPLYSGTLVPGASASWTSSFPTKQPRGTQLILSLTGTDSGKPLIISVPVTLP